MSRGEHAAFPIPTFQRHDGDITWGHEGLTIREHFAGLAIDSVSRELNDGHYTIEQISRELGIKPADYKTEAQWDQFVAKRTLRRVDALIAEMAKPIETPLDTNGNPVKP